MGCIGRIVGSVIGIIIVSIIVIIILILVIINYSAISQFFSQLLGSS
jgi:hypothetical protein